MNEAKQKNESESKTYPTEDQVFQIAYTFAQAKKKYKLLRYIDDAYLNILKQDGYSGKFTFNPLEQPYHELREALCNGLFSNIILEIYSIFFDKRKDVLSFYVRNAIKFDSLFSKDIKAEYEELESDKVLKLYRDKLVAHKDVIGLDGRYKYEHTQLKKLMEFSEKLFDWFIDYCYKSNNITITHDKRYIIEKYYKKDTSDGAIDFFMKQVAGLDRKEIAAKRMAKKYVDMFECLL